MKISVVIPCYYSENMIEQVVNLTKEQLVLAGYDYEFVLVNDGSTDGTFATIQKLSAQDSKVIGIDLLRNFGQHNAIMAGLTYVSGDAVLLMDDDMQTHPSQCLKLVNALEPQIDVVFGAYDIHYESWYRLLGSRFALWSARVLAGCPKNIEDSNYLIMRRCVSDVICDYSSSSVYIQGLIFRTTNRIANVKVQHFEREQGSSGYSIKSLVSLWSTIFNYSIKPLRVVSFLGLLMGLLGFCGAAMVVI